MSAAASFSPSGSRGVYSDVSVEKNESQEAFKVLIQPIMEEARLLVDHYRYGHTCTRPVVAIAGCSSVGKSYFAKQLLLQLQSEGVRVAIVAFDDFLDPEPFEGALPFHPSFDHLKAKAFLKKIADGEEVIEKPAWDRSGIKPCKVKENFDLRGVELLIFDGEYTLHDEQTYNFIGFSNIRIMIDADNNDIIRWNWERRLKGERPSYPKTPTFSEFEQATRISLDKYRQFMEPLKARAQYVLMQDAQHKYTLQTSS